MENKVYLVSHYIPDGLIGVYCSKELAEEAVNRSKNKYGEAGIFERIIDETEEEELNNV
jgi:hypothetical protein